MDRLDYFHRHNIAFLKKNMLITGALFKASHVESTQQSNAYNINYVFSFNQIKHLQVKL